MKASLRHPSRIWGCYRKFWKMHKRSEEESCWRNGRWSNWWCDIWQEVEFDCVDQTTFSPCLQRNYLEARYTQHNFQKILHWKQGSSFVSSGRGLLGTVFCSPIWEGYDYEWLSSMRHVTLKSLFQRFELNNNDIRSVVDFMKEIWDKFLQDNDQLYQGSKYLLKAIIKIWRLTFFCGGDMEEERGCHFYTMCWVDLMLLLSQ